MPACPSEPLRGSREGQIKLQYSLTFCNLQELMASGLLGASMAQPIDDCLITLGKLLVAGPLQQAVMTSSWQPLDLMGKSSGGETKAPPPPSCALPHISPTHNLCRFA